MGEVVRRTSHALGRWVNSGAVAPAFATLCELAGIAAGAPPGAGTAVGVAVGAATGSAAEELVDISRALWFDRTEKAARFADAAESAAGADLADLLTAAAQDPDTLELLAHTVEAATRSLDGWKIDTLACAYVAGARDGAVNDALIVIDTIRQLELPHLRLLAVLSRENWHEGYRAFADLTPGSTTLQMWTPAEILLEDDGLTGGIEALTGKLTTLGLIYDAGIGRYGEHQATYALTDFGRQVAGYLAERGEALREQR